MRLGLKAKPKYLSSRVVGGGPAPASQPLVVKRLVPPRRIWTRAGRKILRLSVASATLVGCCLTTGLRPHHERSRPTATSLTTKFCKSCTAMGARCTTSPAIGLDTPPSSLHPVKAATFSMCFDPTRSVQVGLSIRIG